MIFDNDLKIMTTQKITKIIKICYLYNVNTHKYIKPRIGIMFSFARHRKTKVILHTNWSDIFDLWRGKL